MKSNNNCSCVNWNGICNKDKKRDGFCSLFEPLLLQYDIAALQWHKAETLWPSTAMTSPPSHEAETTAALKSSLTQTSETDKESRHRDWNNTSRGPGAQEPWKTVNERYTKESDYLISLFFWHFVDAQGVQSVLRNGSRRWRLSSHREVFNNVTVSLLCSQFCESVSTEQIKNVLQLIGLQFSFEESQQHFCPDCPLLFIPQSV